MSKYCAYCKEEIFDYEELVIDGFEVFHDFCARQRKTYADSFGVEDDLDIDNLDE